MPTSNLSTFKSAALACLLAFVSASPLFAQTPQASNDAPIRRWLDVQQLTVYSRYRFVENNSDVTTSDQLQYKESIRARFNFDAKKRYTVNVGFFSGSSFTSSWNNWGAGTGDFDGHDHYVKQLFASAIPVDGFEVQGGGIYMARGEQDEFVSYDDDGFLMGLRASLKRPKNFWFDEFTVSRGAIGPLSEPDIADRWDSFKHPNYTQVLGAKKFSAMFAGSLSYERQVGADIVRGAVTVHLSKRALVNTIRYEQYHRFNLHEASGFALWADRGLSKYLRVQGGYVTVDEFYGGWNADRMQNGRRFFGIATIPIYGPLAASLYFTQALNTDYKITINRRFDAVISYDVLDTLRRAHIF